jgi:Dolichyl-phosphate-mannose-protein mannosyltransferase
MVHLQSGIVRLDIMPLTTGSSTSATRLPSHEGTRSVETRQLTYGLIVILLVMISGMLFTLEGWKARTPAFDMLTYFNSAENLLKNGTPARYGDVSSYGAFSPPGSTWLMAPGMLALKDPRLYEKVGSALLHFATLLGVFFLARDVFGIRCAYLSVVLYGLSGLGLAFAGSIWPIGHPAFFVWMAYFAVRWVTHKEPQYLAAAIAVWGVGMYHDMAITPAVLALPVLWMTYRPPFFSRLHLLVAILVLAVWYPFLRFEMSRGFRDLESLLLLHNIMPSDYKVAWCDSGLSLKSLPSTSAPSVSDTGTLQKRRNSGLIILGRVIRLAGRIGDKLIANFQEETPFRRIRITLLLLTLFTLVSFGMNIPFLDARSGSWISRALGAARGVDQTKTAAFVLALAVPWLTLVLVAEPGRPERFFWLWPLQVIALVASVTNVGARLPMPRPLLWIGMVMVIAAVATPTLKSHFERWLRNGWAGSDPEELKVVDYVADQIHEGGREHAAIGYQIFVYEFMPKYAIIDRQYKVGAEFDFLFKHWHSIANTDQCAEGISPNDEYRIVQTRPKDGQGEPRQYFAVPSDKRFRPLRRFDLYQVFKGN